MAECVVTFRVCRLASFELVDGVVEFLQHERRHRVLFVVVLTHCLACRTVASGCDGIGVFEATGIVSVFIWC